MGTAPYAHRSFALSDSLTASALVSMPYHGIDERAEK